MFYRETALTQLLILPQNFPRVIEKTHDKPVSIVYIRAGVKHGSSRKQSRSDNHSVPAFGPVV
jgi:hypothetical protein